MKSIHADRRSTYPFQQFYLRCAPLYVLIALVVFYPVLAHPATRFIGFTDDPAQTMWFMGWFWHAVVHGQNPFVSHFINYPYGVNLMANTAIPAEAIVFGPLVYLVSSAFAYNAMIFVNLCVIGTFGALVLTEFGVRRWLAIIGGVLIELLPYTGAQLQGHANLIVTAWLFGAFYVILRMRNGRWNHPTVAGTVLGVLLAAEFYTSIEVFATCSMVSVIAVVLGLLLARRGTVAFLRALPARFVVTAVVSCLVLLFPGLYSFEYGPYLPTVSTGMYLRSFIVVNDVLNFIVPTPVYLLHNHFSTTLTSRFTGNYSEDDGYLGIVAIALIFWATWRSWGRAFTRVAVPLLVIIALLSLGSDLHVLGRYTSLPMPFLLVSEVPLISEALPSRLMFYGDVLTVLVVFTAFELVLAEGRGRAHDTALLTTGDDNHHRLSHLWRSVCIAAVSFLLMLTWFPAMPYTNFATPTSFRAIEPGGSLFQQLNGEPTLVLSDDFDRVMQGLADGGYAFPVANVYAYQSDSPVQTADRPLSLYSLGGLSRQTLQNHLSRMVANTHVKRVVFVPAATGFAIPSILRNTLTSLYGAPLRNPAGNAYLWDIP